jgi:hypothetical protein
MTLNDAKDIAAIVSSVTTVAAGAAALYWFLFTRRFKRRIEFAADLKIFDLGEENDYVAEIILTVSNKGQREHRLYNLWCEVRQSRVLGESRDIKSYLPLTNFVPEKLQYFFIPSDVVQTFPKSFTIPRTEKIVRVIAMFTYEKERLDLQRLDHLTFEALDKINLTTHSVSKLFEVKPSRCK